MKVTVDGIIYKVWFQHSPELQFEDVPTTIAYIAEADGGGVVRGMTKCSPQDTYTRAKGRKIALARALRAFSKDSRRQVWQGLFAQGMKM